MCTTHTSCVRENITRLPDTAIQSFRSYSTINPNRKRGFRNYSDELIEMNVTAITALDTMNTDFDTSMLLKH